jgi:hypothetical protein
VGSVTYSFVCEVSFPMEPVLATGLKIGVDKLIGAIFYIFCAWLLIDLEPGLEFDDGTARKFMEIVCVVTGFGWLLSMFIKDDCRRFRLA